MHLPRPTPSPPEVGPAHRSGRGQHPGAGAELDGPVGRRRSAGKRATPTDEPGVTANLWEWNWNSIAAGVPDASADLATTASRWPRRRTRSSGPRWATAATRRAPSLVGGLPAGRLRPDQPDGQRGRVQGDGQDLPQAGRQGLRRRGDQPHDRSGQHVLRRQNYTQYNYPASYGAERLPLQGTGECSSSDGGIEDFNNKNQVFKCNLVGLEDLDTETDKVQAELAGYLNKLLGYGVSGFRVDAAKHVGQDDLDAIYSRLNKTKDGVKPYWALEVFQRRPRHPGTRRPSPSPVTCSGSTAPGRSSSASSPTRPSTSAASPRSRCSARAPA